MLNNHSYSENNQMTKKNTAADNEATAKALTKKFAGRANGKDIRWNIASIQGETWLTIESYDDDGQYEERVINLDQVNN